MIFYYLLFIGNIVVPNCVFPCLIGDTFIQKVKSRLNKLDACNAKIHKANILRLII